MPVNVAREMAAMERMSIGELQTRYAEVFGEATRNHHKEYLRKRIIWRLQANAEGGLSERARRRAEELANDGDLRLYAPKDRVASAEASPERTRTGSLRIAEDKRLPMTGTVLTRAYKGQTLRVTVLDGGFEYRGEVYRSLSAIAKVVTGAHWNGFHFFGLAGGKEAV